MQVNPKSMKFVLTAVVLAAIVCTVAGKSVKTSRLGKCEFGDHT